MIYLDNNATTQPDPAVVEAMLPFLRGDFFNPSAAYRPARVVRAALEEARAQVSVLLGCAPEEVIFTSGGTEADNAAIDSARMFWPARRRLVIGATEHPAVLEPARRWERDGGLVTRVRVDADGVIDLDALRGALSEGDTALVSIMWANNETGVIAPMQEIVEIAHSAGALLHTDAVQAAGKISLDLAASPVDYLALSGHKMHAPKGVGALFISKRVRFRPSITGGGQEHERRGGTENVAGIVALGAAAEIAARHLSDGSHARVVAMRDRFEQVVLEALPETRLNGSREKRLGNTSSLSFPGIDAAGMVILLDEKEVCVSAGAACHAGAVHSSHVLEAMNIDANGSLRFSFSRMNTEEEADTAASEVVAAARKLRSL